MAKNKQDIGNYVMNIILNKENEAYEICGVSKYTIFRIEDVDGCING